MHKNLHRQTQQHKGDQLWLVEIDKVALSLKCANALFYDHCASDCKSKTYCRGQIIYGALKGQ